MATKEVEIGSLKVRTVGSGANKVRVVLLPGHEFGIEHFLPENLKMNGRISTRTRIFRSRLSPEVRFAEKKGLRRMHAIHNIFPLKVLNEARLAAFVNRHAESTGFPDIHVEQPLAVVHQPGSALRVIYRYTSPMMIRMRLPKQGAAKQSKNALEFERALRRINKRGKTSIRARPRPEQSQRVLQFVSAIRRMGIDPYDIQWDIDRSNRIHVYDIEFWKVHPQLKKLISIRGEVGGEPTKQTDVNGGL